MKKESGAHAKHKHQTVETIEHEERDTSVELVAWMAYPALTILFFVFLGITDTWFFIPVLVVSLIPLLLFFIDQICKFAKAVQSYRTKRSHASK